MINAPGREGEGETGDDRQVVKEWENDGTNES